MKILNYNIWFLCLFELIFNFFAGLIPEPVNVLLQRLEQQAFAKVQCHLQKLKGFFPSLLMLQILNKFTSMLKWF